MFDEKNLSYTQSSSSETIKVDPNGLFFNWKEVIGKISPKKHLRKQQAMRPNSATNHPEQGVPVSQSQSSHLQNRCELFRRCYKDHADFLAGLWEPQRYFR